MQDAKREIRSLLLEELEEELKALGAPGYRVGQVFSWLGKGAASFEEMTDISKGLREKLAGEYTAGSIHIENMQQSALDGTRKYLFSLDGGGLIEGVFMEYRTGIRPVSHHRWDVPWAAVSALLR